MEEIVIVAGARTAVGAFNGAFASLPAHQLGKVAIEAALRRAKVDAGDVSEVILGQVLTAAQGQNPARQAAIAAGLPIGAPAWGINMVCGSGLRAVALGAQAIRNGDSRIVVAGGQESMSQSTHAAYLRAGQKMGDLNLIDTMIKDGLWDAFNGYHMGNTAENVAQQWQITREEQDKFAVASQNKAEAARKAGRFKDEIAPVTVKNRKGETVVDTDEYIRDGATFEAMTGLRPAFAKDGTVTAGNASGLNDGAAALVLMSAKDAAARGLTPLARIASWAQAGVDPKVMGSGPIPASRKALE
ncbi:MAG: acetyl-CoA C-acyltransferase, partial [Rhizomicrobium sp.]